MKNEAKAACILLEAAADHGLIETLSATEHLMDTISLLFSNA